MFDTNMKKLNEVSESVLDFINDIKEKTKDNDKWGTIFENVFTNTLETTVKYLEDGDTYVLTGDIPAMWLRDSTAQVRPYLILAQNDKEIADMIKGLVRRQFKLITHDPYANAFNEDFNGAGHQSDDTELTDLIWERKYEIDSLAYPLQLAYLYYKNTGDASVDTKELTPSQTQSDGDGVPTPTFQFISEDESITVDGQLESSISDDDMTFVIEPKRALTVGIWTISIKSISDDVGNTADTVEYTLEVKGVAAAAGKAEIIWADAHDNADYYGDGVFYDVVHIQYGTEMSLDALQSNIYTINGKILPVGTMIVSDEEVYDTVNNLEGTRVTIVLPKEFLGSIDNIEINDATDYDNDYDEPHMLNVSKQLTDAKGNKIISPTEVELKYEKAGYSVVH